ncbi:MAG: hypothetical protein EAY65_00945 [Alphaproteobacteria bacterium]|nr:MAG: hypothetical protein EAY65_00945 [Alphaproteobacteria bacterium]
MMQTRLTRATLYVMQTRLTRALLVQVRLDPPLKASVYAGFREKSLHGTRAKSRYFVPFLANARHNLDTVKRYGGSVLCFNLAIHLSIFGWMPHFMMVSQAEAFLWTLPISTIVAWFLRD